MARNTTSSNYRTESAERRIKEAWERLYEVGFDTENHERSNDWPWLLEAAQCFNATTLWKVFGLALAVTGGARVFLFSTVFLFPVDGLLSRNDCKPTVEGESAL
jgi:hypothetical protein